MAETAQNTASTVATYHMSRKDLILTPDGVFSVSEDDVVFDNYEALVISRTTWEATLKKYKSLNTQSLIEDETLNVNSIVILQSELTTKETACVWCVRISVAAPINSANGLGEHFLWPLPYWIARNAYDHVLAQNILDGTDVFNGVDEELKPTHHSMTTFDASLWPNCAKQEYLNDFHDRMFVMSMGLPAPQTPQGISGVPKTQNSRWLARPYHLRKHGCFGELPDDLKQLIFGNQDEGLFFELLSSDNVSSFSHLLQLRLVSKGMCKFVDNSVCLLLQKLKTYIRNGHVEKSVPKLLKAHNLCSKYQLSPVALEWEHELGVFAFARLRTKREPWRRMPPKTTRPVPQPGDFMIREMTSQERGEIKKMLGRIDMPCVGFINQMCRCSGKSFFPVDQLDTKTLWLIWAFLFTSRDRSTLFRHAEEWSPMVSQLGKRPAEAPLTAQPPSRAVSAEI